MCESWGDAPSLLPTCKELHEYRRTILLPHTTVYLDSPGDIKHLQSLDHFIGKDNSLYGNILDLEVVANRCPSSHSPDIPCIYHLRPEDVVFTELLGLYQKATQVQTLTLRKDVYPMSDPGQFGRLNPFHVFAKLGQSVVNFTNLLKLFVECPVTGKADEYLKTIKLPLTHLIPASKCRISAGFHPIQG